MWEVQPFPDPLRENKPCPFCGGHKVEVHFQDWLDLPAPKNLARVTCATCGAQGPVCSSPWADSKLPLCRVALTMWDTRTV